MATPGFASEDTTIFSGSPSSIGGDGRGATPRVVDSEPRREAQNPEPTPNTNDRAQTTGNVAVSRLPATRGEM